MVSLTRFLNNKLLKITGLILPFFLSSCKNDFSYQYLMHHPAVLEKALALCEKQPVKSKQCETVLFAAANFMSYVNQEREDPQAFGERILKGQMAYAKAKADHAANADVLQDQLATMNAVVGLNSPE